MNKFGNKYIKIHKWLKDNFGVARECENKLCTQIKGLFRYNWALKRGLSYKKKRDNFIKLCPLCHKRYDLGWDIFDKNLVFKSYQLTRIQASFIKRKSKKDKVSESTAIRVLLNKAMEA